MGCSRFGDCWSPHPWVLLFPTSVGITHPCALLQILRFRPMSSSRTQPQILGFIHASSTTAHPHVLWLRLSPLKGGSVPFWNTLTTRCRQWDGPAANSRRSCRAGLHGCHNTSGPLPHPLHRRHPISPWTAAKWPINFSSGIKPDKTQPCRCAGLPTPDLEVRSETRGVGCGDGGRTGRAVRGSVRDRRGLRGAGMRRGGGRAGGCGARLAAAGTVVGAEAGGSARAAGPAGRRLPASPQGLPRAPAPPERPSPAPPARPRGPAGWAEGRAGRGAGAAAATQLREGEASA